MAENQNTGNPGGASADAAKYEKRMRKMYETLRKDGRYQKMTEGTFEDFRSHMDNSKHREKLFGYLTKDKYNAGKDFNEFSSAFGYGVDEQPASVEQPSTAASMPAGETGGTEAGGFDAYAKERMGTIFDASEEVQKGADVGRENANKEIAEKRQKAAENAVRGDMSAVLDSAKAELAANANADMTARTDTPSVAMQAAKLEANLKGDGVDPNAVYDNDQSTARLRDVAAKVEEKVKPLMEDFTKRRTALDEEKVALDETQKTYEASAAELKTKYPEGWQPKTKAEAEACQKDLDDFKALEEAYNKDIETYNKNVANVNAVAETIGKITESDPRNSEKFKKMYVAARKAMAARETAMYNEIASANQAGLSSGGYGYSSASNIKAIQDKYSKLTKEEEDLFAFVKKHYGYDSYEEAMAAINRYNANETAKNYTPLNEEMLDKIQAMRKEMGGAVIRPDMVLMSSSLQPFAQGMAAEGYGDVSTITREIDKERENKAVNLAAAALLTQGTADWVKDYRTVVGQRDENGNLGVVNQLKNTGTGTMQATFNLDTWDFGLTDLSKNMALYKVATKAENGEDLTEDEEMLLNAASLNMMMKSSLELGLGFTAGQVTGESLPFMMQMFLSPYTKVAGSLASKVINGAYRRAIKLGFKNVMKNRVVNLATKVTGHLIGDNAAAGLMAVADPQAMVKTVAGGYERAVSKIEGTVGEDGKWHFTDIETKDLVSSMYGSVADMVSEQASELAGTSFFDKGLSALYKNFGGNFGKLIGEDAVKALSASKVGQWLTAIPESEYWRTMQGLRKQFQMSGLISETMEELYGDLQRKVFGVLEEGKTVFSYTDDQGVYHPGVLSLQNFGETALTLMPTQVMFGVLGAGMYGMHRSEVYHKFGEAQAYMRNAFGENSDLLNQTLQQIEGFKEEEFGNKLKELLESQDLNNDQKAAIARYGFAYQMKRGMDNAESLMGSRDLNESMAMGHFERGFMMDISDTETVEDEMYIAQNDRDELQRVYDNLNDKEQQKFNRILALVAVGRYADAMSQMYDDGTSAEQRAALDLYIQSYVTQRGIRERINAERGIEVSAAQAWTESIVNQEDGSITPVTLADGRTGYLRTTDGASFGWVKLEDGSTVFADYDDMTIGEAQSVEDFITPIAQGINDRYAQVLNEAMGKVPEMRLNTVIPVVEGSAEQNWVVTGYDGENYTVTSPSGETRQVDKDFAQQQHDAVVKARIADKIRERKERNDMQQPAQPTQPTQSAVDQQGQQPTQPANAGSTGAEGAEGAGEQQQGGGAQQQPASGVPQRSAEMQSLLDGNAVEVNLGDGRRSWLKLRDLQPDENGNYVADVYDANVDETDEANVVNSLTQTEAQFEKLLHPEVSEEEIAAAEEQAYQLVIKDNNINNRSVEELQRLLDESKQELTTETNPIRQAKLNGHIRGLEEVIPIKQKEAEDAAKEAEEEAQRQAEEQRKAEEERQRQEEEARKQAEEAAKAQEEAVKEAEENAYQETMQSMGSQSLETLIPLLEYGKQAVEDVADPIKKAMYQGRVRALEELVAKKTEEAEQKHVEESARLERSLEQDAGVIDLRTSFGRLPEAKQKLEALEAEIERLNNEGKFTEEDYKKISLVAEKERYKLEDKLREREEKRQQEEAERKAEEERKRQETEARRKETEEARRKFEEEQRKKQEEGKEEQPTEEPVDDRSQYEKDKERVMRMENPQIWAEIERMGIFNSDQPYSAREAALWAMAKGAKLTKKALFTEVKHFFEMRDKKDWETNEVGQVTELGKYRIIDKYKFWQDKNGYETFDAWVHDIWEGLPDPDRFTTSEIKDELMALELNSREALLQLWEMSYQHQHEYDIDEATDILTHEELDKELGDNVSQAQEEAARSEEADMEAQTEADANAQRDAELGNAIVDTEEREADEAEAHRQMDQEQADAEADEAVDVDNLETNEERAQREAEAQMPKAEAPKQQPNTAALEKEIEDIKKKYADKKKDLQKKREQAVKEKRAALRQIQGRSEVANSLFGDLRQKEEDDIFDTEEVQEEYSSTTVRNALRPYDERIAAIDKQLGELDTLMNREIEEAKKQTRMEMPDAEGEYKLEDFIDNDPTGDGEEDLPFQRGENVEGTENVTEAQRLATEAEIEMLNRAGIEATMVTQEEGQRRADEADGKVEKMAFANSPEEFKRVQEEATRQNGVVYSGLAEKVVSIVNIARHSFTGSIKEAVNAARLWAKQNLIGKEYSLIDNGGNYVISNAAIDKYLSSSAFIKSDNKGVHLSVLTDLPNVIANSIDVEIHPDYKKVDGTRSAKNGIDKSDRLVHRLYGAINIDGTIYRVKTTMHEYSNGNVNTPHSYEVTKIELIDASSADLHQTEPVTMTPNNSISGAKLLKNVEKSYDSGKKVLEESKKSSFSGGLSSKDSKNGRETLKTTSGIVYGWTENGKIYLTPKGVNPNTPVHEYTHLWAKAVMAKNPELWNSTKGLLKQTDVWNEVLNDPAYESIRGNEDAVASEVLARLSGKKNAEKMTNMAQEMLDRETTEEGKSKVRSLIDAVKKAIDDVWHWIGVNLFDMKEFNSIEEVTDRVLWDLANGTDLGTLNDGVPEFHKVTAEEAKDPHIQEVMKEFEEGKTVKVYRAMQVIDGQLYPPMAAKVEGQLVEPTKIGDVLIADERPDLAKNGKFKLDKANGSAIDAAYNPYWHTSRSPLNDQFSSAWNRGNLVTVEVEVPLSELTSGYKAEGAKDPVGETEWKSGPVGNQLAKDGKPRKVILSRYCKVARVIPEAEVAKAIADLLEGTKVEGIPFNTVTPTLRDELVKAGVKITEPQKGNAGNAARAEYEKWKQHNAEGAEAGKAKSVSDVNKEVEEFLKPDRLSMTEKMARDRHDAARAEIDGMDVANMDDIERSMAAIEKGLSGAFSTYFDGMNFAEHPDVPEAVRDAFSDAEYKHEDIPDAIKRQMDDAREEMDSYSEDEIETDEDAKRYYNEAKDKVKELEDALDWYKNHKSELTLAPEEFFDKDGKYVGAQNVKVEERGRFRRTSPNGRTVDAMSTEEVQGKVNEVAQKLGVEVGKDVVVLDSLDDVPYQHVRDMFSENKACGYYSLQDGKLYIYAPNAQNEEDIERTMLHESVGHKGLRKWIGDKVFNAAMKAAFDMLPGVERGKIIGRAKELAAEYGRGNSESYINEAMEEHFAETAEEGDMMMMPWYKKLYQAIRDAIRTLGFKLTLTPDDVQYMLWRGSEMLRRADEPAWRKAMRDMAMRRKFGIGMFENDVTGGEDAAPAAQRTGQGSNNEYRLRRPMPDRRDAAQMTYDASMKGAWAKFDEAWHDNMRSLDRLERAIIVQTGGRLRDDQDVYLHMQHLTSKNQSEINKLQREHIEPLTAALNECMKNIAVTEEEIQERIDLAKEQGKKLSRSKAETEAKQKKVERYLIAMHGAERNEVFATRDAKRVAAEAYDEKIAAAKANVEQQKQIITDEHSKRVAAGVRTKSAEELAAEAALPIAEAELQDLEKKKQDYEDKKYIEFRQKDYAGLTDLFWEEGDADDLDLATYEQRAEQFAVDMEAQVGDTQMAKLRDAVKKIADFSVEKIYKSGLINKGLRDHINSMFKNYVPLQGWDETTASEEYYYADNASRRSSVATPLRNAKGRVTEAGDIIATLVAQANAAILQGNKNMAKQALLNLAMDHKTRLLTVGRAWYMKQGNRWIPVILPSVADTSDPDFGAAWAGKSYADKAYQDMTDAERDEYQQDFEAFMRDKKSRGEATQKRANNGVVLDVPATGQQEDQHVVRVKKNGVEYVININGAPNAAQAVNGLLNESGEGTRHIAAINRYMARNFTSKSPYFLFRNMQRDIQSAVNLSGVKFGSDYATKLSANLALIMPVAGKAFNSERSSLGFYSGIGKLYNKLEEGTLDDNVEIERLFKEFIENGGETGYSQLWTVEDAKKRVEAIRESLENGKFKAGKEWLGDNVEWLNKIFENTTRFAVYMTSRQMGKSPLKSVNDAKEASTNFNKHGSGAWGNAYFRNVFMFANAAIQGLYRYIDLTLNKEGLHASINDTSLKPRLSGRAAVSFGMWLAAGAANTLVQMMLYSMAYGGGDDDEYYNKYLELSNFKRWNQINIFGGEDTVVSFNIGQEESVPYSIGCIIAENLMGVGTGHAMSDVISQVTKVSPLGDIDMERLVGKDFDDGLIYVMGTFMPASIKPWFELATNADYAGHAISNQSDFNKGKPEWQRMRANSPKWQKELSKYLYEATNEHVDINLNKVDHIMKNYFGGPYDFIIKSASGIQKTWDWYYNEENDTPIDQIFPVFNTTIGKEYQEGAYIKRRFDDEMRSLSKAKQWYDDATGQPKDSEDRQRRRQIRANHEGDPEYDAIKIWNTKEKYKKRYEQWRKKGRRDKMRQIELKWLYEIGALE